MEDGTNPLENRRGMFDHLLVGEAQDGDALTVEEGVAESVTSLSRGVVGAVHLDGQFGFDAKEVGEVGADGELSTELEAVDLSAAQPAPEERFGRGGAVAVPAAEHDLTSKSSLHEGGSTRSSSQFRGISTGSRGPIVARCEGSNRRRAEHAAQNTSRSRSAPVARTTRTVSHAALAQTCESPATPPTHEASPLTHVRGAGGGETAAPPSQSGARPPFQQPARVESRENSRRRGRSRAPSPA
jgi:hypothetical protein